MPNNGSTTVTMARHAKGGLRDTQKRARTERILNAASDLFRTKSFDETTVEEIAELAELSVGTVFNYYGSKVNILLSLIEIENTKIVKVASRPRSGSTRLNGAGICKLLERITTESLSLVAPAAWR